MQPQIILQPIHNSSADILKCFALGKPLSSDQLNFIDWHQKQLSSPEFDPVYKYYIESAKKKHTSSMSFLLHSEELTAESSKQLKRRLSLLLQQKASHALIGFTQKQFLQFKELNTQELIFWHGNQFLTAAPFFPGGIPPVIYFQWGNLFGIVKYVILADEKALKANILIYFEDMQDRFLDQCVEDYKKTLKIDLEIQQHILNENKIKPPAFDHFIIKTPTLTLDPMKKLSSSR
jgi:hypothetical protein